MYLPHAIRDICTKLEGWTFVGTNQGSSMTYSVEFSEKFWDEEDGTFSIVEIAAYLRAEMAKKGLPINVDTTGLACYYTKHDDIEEAWTFGSSFDSADAEDEARAVIECVYMSLGFVK